MHFKLCFSLESEEPFCVRLCASAMTTYCELNSFCLALSLLQGELEKLNQSTDNINRWETELEVKFTCMLCGVTVFTENGCGRNSKVENV
uniref:SH3 domain-binding protein 5 n=1 Tax=Sinocyclocheilus rhinocerous TaxID=307959 RepID=A0A673FRT3_9TELE